MFNRYMTWDQYRATIQVCMWRKPSEDWNTVAALNAQALEFPSFALEAAYAPQLTVFDGKEQNVWPRKQHSITWNLTLKRSWQVRYIKHGETSLSLIFRNWGKLFKQELIHMENHLPRICLLLRSDPRHQEVNNILYKHWVLTQNQ